MQIENIINTTIKWYVENDVAFFNKSHAPLTVIETTATSAGFGDVDYYGIYQGRYIAFEAKETKGDYFSMSQLKPHQHYSLKKITENGGIAFLMINFISHENNIWVIDGNRLLELLEQQIRRIDIKSIKSFATQVPIEFPGICDFVKHFIVQ